MTISTDTVVLLLSVVISGDCSWMKQPCNIEIPLTKRSVIVMDEIFKISFVGNNKSYKTSAAEFSLLITCTFSLDTPQGKKKYNLNLQLSQQCSNAIKKPSNCFYGGK